MSVEKTLSIIKPDAVAKHLIGEINRRFEKAGLRIVAAKMKHLTKQEAQGFYAVHKERPFFNALVNFMSSGPVITEVVEGENASTRNRQIPLEMKQKEDAATTSRADIAEYMDCEVV